VGIFNGPLETCTGFGAPVAVAAAPRDIALAAVQSWEENGPKKEGWNQSARPSCSHGVIPSDLRRAELFKQMAKIIRVAGVSARSSVSSMLPGMTHVTSSSQHDAGGGTRHRLPRSGFMASPVGLLNFSKLTMRWG